MEIVKGNDTTLEDILTGKKRCFVIPPFQRNYSWDSKQCEELFDDIINSIKEKKPHYLGNIVSFAGKNDSAGYTEKILVDGQQRLTTVLLLICAIKDFVPDEGLKEELQEYYLINKGRDTNRIKLKQTSNDIEVFEAIINGTIENLSSDLKNNNQLINNYNFFVNLLRKLDKGIKIDDLLFSIAKTEIIDITIIDKDNMKTVQTIFEKINSTGKPLTSGDLIRNYLLLAKSSDEQMDLYKKYWIDIEKRVKDITKFAKVYYILDAQEIVEEDNIYTVFKSYYDQIEKSHLDILKEMNEMSNYYNNLERLSFNSDKIKRNIKYLKKLKYEDLIPLIVLLIKEHCASRLNNDEFERIFDLLVDFMFRYRIVKPYTGGSPLKKLVINLVKKILNDNVEITYDFLLFELSNSAEANQRFPLDDEFKNSLINDKKDKYKKELLLRLEDNETKSIKIDVDSDLTLEHLMPQTKSKWWVENLGGNEKYQIIYDKYLNSIGNLAILSRGYNSVNSNASWDERLTQLSSAQFQVTQELKEYSKWQEEQIIERNDKLADRILKIITSPLQRIRDYESIKSNDDILDDFEPGVYDLNDTNFPECNIIITRFAIGETTYNVNSWRDFFNKLCKHLYDIKRPEFDQIVNNNVIHKSKKNLKYKYDPIITKDARALQKAMKIEGTDYYNEAQLSESRVLYYARKLINELKYSDNIEMFLSI